MKELNTIKLSAHQIDEAQSILDNSQLGVHIFYDYIYERGDIYGRLGASVTNNDTWQGQIANGFFESAEGIAYGSADWVGLNQRLAQAHLDTISENGGALPNLNQISSYHYETYIENGYHPNSWFPNILLLNSSDPFSRWVDWQANEGAIDLFEDFLHLNSLGVVVPGFTRPRDIPSASEWIEISKFYTNFHQAFVNLDREGLLTLLDDLDGDTKLAHYIQVLLDEEGDLIETFETFSTTIEIDTAIYPYIAFGQPVSHLIPGNAETIAIEDDYINYVSSDGGNVELFLNPSNGDVIYKKASYDDSSISVTQSIEFGFAGSIERLSFEDFTIKGIPIGQLVGGAIGRHAAANLDIDNFLLGVTADALISAVVENVGEFVHAAAINIALSELVVDGQSFSKLIEGVLDGTVNHGNPNADSIGAEFEGFLSGTVASAAVNEVLKAFEIDGLAGEVVGSISTTIGAELVPEVFDYVFHGVELGEFLPEFDGSFNFDLSGFGSSLATLGTRFAAGKLAGEIIAPESQEAAIFGSIGGSIGATFSSGIATFLSITGFWAGPIGAGIGAFIGQIAGTFLGNLFGSDDEPRAWVTINSSRSTGQYEIGAVRTDDGGDPGVPLRMAEAASKAVNEIVALTGGNFRRDSGISVEIGYDGDTYFVESKGSTREFNDPQAAVKHAALKLFQGADIVGGHAVLMRAWHNSEAETLEAFQQDLIIAEAFQTYLLNPVGVIALMLNAPESGEAQQWAAILQRAEELELHLPHEKDFDGGWGEVLAARGDINPESIPSIEGTSLILTDPVTGEVVELEHIIGPGYEIVRTKGTDGEDTISLRVDGPSITFTDAGPGDDQFVGTEGADIFLGGPGDDEADLGGGPDIGNGGDGNDTLIGGEGDDLLVGGEGDDSLVGEAGVDEVYGGDGDDTIEGGPDTDRLDGGHGDDEIHGGAGRSDRLYGREDDDILYLYDSDLGYGGEGDDTVHADGGANTYYVERLADGHDTLIPATGGSLRIFIDRNISFNELFFQRFGSDLKVSIIGRDQSFTVQDHFAGKHAKLYLNNGNLSLNKAGGFVGTTQSLVNAHTALPSTIEGDYNLIDDGALAQFNQFPSGSTSWYFHNTQTSYSTHYFNKNFHYGDFWGNPNFRSQSNDNYVYRNANSWVKYQVYLGAGDDIATPSNYNNLGTSFRLFGGSGNDTLHDINRAGYLFGGIGNDRLYGRNGGDFLYGGHGNDQIYGGNHDDEIEGYVGDDTLFGGNNDDFIDGGDGNDIIYGGAGNDTIFGGAGDDQIVDQSGWDNIDAGDGDDLVDATGNGTHFIDLGAGNDTAQGGSADDRIDGDAGNDSIDGGAGGDHLSGGDGSDTLDGGDGSDQIHAGSGDDVVHITHLSPDSVTLGDGDDVTYVTEFGAHVIVGDEGVDTVSLAFDGLRFIEDRARTLEGRIVDALSGVELRVEGVERFEDASTGDLYSFDDLFNSLPTLSSERIETAEDRAALLSPELFGLNDAVSASIVFRVTLAPTIGALLADGQEIGFGETFSFADIENGRIAYRPEPDANGDDQIGISVEDHLGVLEAAVLPIIVRPVNDVPVPQDQSFELDEDGVLSGRVVAVDVDGDGLTYQLADGGDVSHGALDLRADGSFTYTPGANFHGVDAFTYIVEDGQGGSVSKIVSLEVRSVNDAPVPQDQSFELDEDGVLSGRVVANDVDGDGLTYQLADGGDVSHGALDLRADGSFIYTPGANFHSVDAFTYIVEDGQGGSVSKTVSLEVRSVNDAPVPQDQSFELDEDGVLSGRVVANDVDGDGQTYQLTDGGDVAHGVLEFRSDGSFTYTPGANFHGADAFIYIVEDGHGGSVAKTVSLEVRPVNDAPVVDYEASANVGGLWEHIEINLDLAEVFIDPDGDRLTYELLGVAGANVDSHKVSLTEGGSLTILPGAARDPKIWGGHTLLQLKIEATDPFGVTSQYTLSRSVKPTHKLKLLQLGSDASLHGIDDFEYLSSAFFVANGERHSIILREYSAERKAVSAQDIAEKLNAEFKVRNIDGLHAVATNLVLSEVNANYKAYEAIITTDQNSLLIIGDVASEAWMSGFGGGVYEWGTLVNRFEDLGSLVDVTEIEVTGLNDRGVFIFDQVVASPVEQPVEPPVEQPVEPPVEQPVEPPVEQPVEPPVEQPALMISADVLQNGEFLYAQDRNQYSIFLEAERYNVQFFGETLEMPWGLSEVGLISAYSADGTRLTGISNDPMVLEIAEAGLHTVETWTGNFYDPAQGSGEYSFTIERIVPFMEPPAEPVDPPTEPANPRSVDPLPPVPGPDQSPVGDIPEPPVDDPEPSMASPNPGPPSVDPQPPVAEPDQPPVDTPPEHDGLGTPSDDVMVGNSGANEMFGLQGADKMTGLGGSDMIRGGGGNDTLIGNGGRDLLAGGGRHDELRGGGDRDTLLGGGGRDDLDGGGGRDSLHGGGGRDTIEGGHGADILSGGGGRDFFEFKTGDGRDRITDYRDGQDNFLITRGADEFEDLTIAQRGDDAFIRFANVRIIVEDIDANSLGANDFIFS